MPKQLDDKLNDLSYNIIGACMDVHKTLGAGLLESIYEQALCIELEDRELSFVRQPEIGILYKGHAIGNFRADVIVANQIIIELKAVERILPVHQAQLMTYLKITNIRLGLLINFNTSILKNGIKRVIL